MARSKGYLPLLSFVGAGCTFLVYFYWDKIKGRLRSSPDDDDIKEKEDKGIESSTEGTDINTSKNQKEAVLTMVEPVDDDNIDQEDADDPQEEEEPQALKHVRQAVCVKRGKKDWTQKKGKRGSNAKRKRVVGPDQEIFTSYLGGQEFKSICKLVPVEELHRSRKQKVEAVKEDIVATAGQEEISVEVEPGMENIAAAGGEEMRSLKVEPVTDNIVVVAAAAEEEMSSTSLEVKPVMESISAVTGGGEETSLKIEAVMENIVVAGVAGEEMSFHTNLEVEPVMENIAAAAAGGEETSEVPSEQ